MKFIFFLLILHNVLCLEVLNQIKPDPYSNIKNYPGKYPKGYCGVVSAQIILSSNGIKVSRDYIALSTSNGALTSGYTDRGQVYLNGIGTRYFPLVKLARRLGLEDSKLFTNIDLEKVKKLIKDNPLMVSFKGSISYDGYYRRTKGHVVVIESYSRGSFIIIDPAVPYKVQMDEESFKKVFRGIAVVLL